MKISASAAPLSGQKRDALVLFFQEKENLLPTGDAALAKAVAGFLEKSAFKGDVGQVALFPSCGAAAARHCIVAGVGPARHFHRGLLEQAAAAAVRAGRAAGLDSFAMAPSIRLPGLADADYQLLAGRGAAWGSYEFTAFKSVAAKKAEPSLAFAGGTADRGAVRTAAAQAAALLRTADLANLPGNEATPRHIAAWAQSMARENGLSCQVLGKAELRKRGCGALLSVAQGSAQDAMLVILKHPGKDKRAKPAVLVGKTITFDTGGISLKPGKNMGWMRYDKAGGMAVLAAMQMAARMEVGTPVAGILAVAENMPGANATRPGDIVTACNGKTIEILNTDAEGRLVLADALALAAEMAPRAIVDLATLTGAVITALGNSAAAILGNDQALVDALAAAGAAAGERLWQLPLYKDYSDEMKSDFADLSNLGKSGGAGTATAAAFLQEFVPESVPWAHLDIAGTAWLESAKPHQAPGTTLFGARLLAGWLAGLA